MAVKSIEVIKELERKVWIEWCLSGDVTVNIQYGDEKPHSFARFYFIPMVTRRDWLEQAAISTALRLGATQPIEQRQQSFEDGLREVCDALDKEYSNE